MVKKPANLPFEVGQLAEARTFLEGFRGAWFICRIVRINKREKTCTLKYPHFPDEKLEKMKLYQLPLDIEGKEIEGVKKEIMIRPSYPTILSQKKMPPESEIPEVAVIVDNMWKVGDLVDWWKDYVYWSGTIVQLLGDDKAKIELKPKPLGEGLVDEISLKDIRPSLDWSMENGWTLPTQDEGTGHPCAVLIRPGDQVQDTQHVGHESQNPAESLTMPSISSSLTQSASSSSEAQTVAKMQVKKRSLEKTVLEEAIEADTQEKTKSADCRSGSAGEAFEAINNVGTEKKASNADCVSGSPMELEGAETNFEQPRVEVHQDLNKNCPVQKVRAGEGVLLHSPDPQSAEAAVLDLEACLMKIQNLKSLLLSVGSSSDATKADEWELEINDVSSKPK